jgi:hypothetical protein
MRPVLKDRSAAGRKAALARWGNRADDTTAVADQAKSNVGGRALDMSVIGDDGYGIESDKYGRYDENHANPTGVARVVEAQGWNKPAQSVTEEQFIALKDSGDFVAVYRGGPPGIEKGMLEGTPFVGDGVLGPGTYCSTDPQRASVFAHISLRENPAGGAVVPMLVPRSMFDSAPPARRNIADDPLTDHGLKGVGMVANADYGGDYVVWNTSAVIVGPPVSVERGTDFGDAPDSPLLKQEDVELESGPYYRLLSDRAELIEFDEVKKADRSAAGRKAALARWGNRSGTETKAPAKESKPAKSGKTLNIPNADKSREFIDKHYGEWKKNLPEAQDKAMRFYQSPGYELMNGELRGQKVDAPEADLKRARKATKDLKQAIAESPPLEQDTIVYRGFSAEQFDLKPGASIRDEAFLSTSLFADGAGAFSGSGPQVKATIKLPAGTKAAAGSFKELVLPPGSEFKVVSVGKGTVELELVSPVEKADRSAAGRKAAEARWGNRGLGIAREDMPQIPKKNRDKFFAQLDAEGVGYRDETVDPRTLKQTQAGLNPKQTKVLLDAMRGGSFRGDTHTIIAAKDGHILDGHHRWDAARKFAAEGGSADIRITRVDMSIRELLDRAARFNAEEGIESRGMETVSTFNKAVTLTFAPGLRPVLKGSRTEAARYAASVRWRDAKATVSATADVMGSSPSRAAGYSPTEDYQEAVYRALRYNDFSGLDIGSSKAARRLGGAIGRLERKLDQFRKRKGWKKQESISPEDARALREDYDRRYRPWLTT